MGARALAHFLDDCAMPNVTTGLVIGYGSVGRRHARALAALAPALVIVERQDTARGLAVREHPAARVVDCLEALDGDGFPWSSALAVIATWGPSHATLFHALADRGVRRILCEKPMASSVRDAWAMVERAERAGVSLAVDHYLRYVGVAPALRRLATDHQLGAPVAVVVAGGAGCLLTNGIHWIDFAIELFGGAPRQVFSTAYGDAINPRSGDLLLYGGTAVWDFGGHREAVISFTNRSSVALRARVYFRDAVAEIDGDLSVLLRCRDPAAVKRYPAITRTGSAGEVLFQGVLPGVLAWSDGVRMALEQLVRGDAAACPGRVGAAAVVACAGALAATREDRVVELPITATSAWWEKRWPIS